MSKGKVTVLGINGHIGHHAAQAFRHAGWDVTAFGRTNRKPIAGIKFVTGDAADLGALKAVIADADIVVNALNLPYDKWDKGRAEAQLATVIEAMGNSGKTMMYPGNVYNYAATDRRMAPSTPQRSPRPPGHEPSSTASPPRGSPTAGVLPAANASSRSKYRPVFLEAGYGRVHL